MPWAVLVIALAAAGWYVGHRFWDRGLVGLLVPCGLALFAWGLTDEVIRAILGYAAGAFVAAVPVVYVLVVVEHVALALLHQIRFTAHDAFVASILGVLVGCGAAVLLNVKGTFERGADSSAGLDASALTDFFLTGLAFRIPMAFLIATLFQLPETPPSRIVTGASWGVVAAVSMLVYSVCLHHKSVREALAAIAVVEIVMAFGLYTGVVTGLFEHKTLLLTLELVPAAGAGCFLTYLVARFGAVVRQEFRSTRS
jgi:hypothetical protein